MQNFISIADVEVSRHVGGGGGSKRPNVYVKDLNSYPPVNCF